MRIKLYATVFAVAAVAIVLVTVAQGDSKFFFRTVGQCVSTWNGGTLHSESAGFTAGKFYITKAWYPRNSKYKGKPYPVWGIKNPGIVDALGHTSGWSWNCGIGAYERPDPPGKYRLQVTDRETGRTAETTFTVGSYKAQPK